MPILYDTREHIAYITITNPGKANMLDRETASQLSAAWSNAWEDREVRAVIITGEGDRHFCAGHNLTPPPGTTADEREFLRSSRPEHAPLFHSHDEPRAVVELQKPVASRVPGGDALQLGDAHILTGLCSDPAFELVTHREACPGSTASACR